MPLARAENAIPNLLLLSGVKGARYDKVTHELLLELSGSITVKDRQKVIDAIAQAANAPGTG